MNQTRESLKRFVMSEPVLALRVMALDIPSEAEYKQIVVTHKKKLIECGLGNEISQKDGGYSLFRAEVARLLG